MSTAQQETVVPWRPAMVFNPRRRSEDPPTLLEDFIEKSATTLYRAYIPSTPNHNFGPMMAKATRYVFIIDLFLNDEAIRNAFFDRLRSDRTPSSLVATIFQDGDLVHLLCVLGGVPNSASDPLATARAERLRLYNTEPNTLDQLVWAIAHPNDAHPGVLRDLGDDFFVAVLLIRHFRYYGGLVLPTLQAARTKEAAHQALRTEVKTQGYSTNDIMMHYPNWRDSLSTHFPRGLGGS